MSIAIRHRILFEHILDFLRDGQIYLPDNRLDLHYRLLAEAEFYGKNFLSLSLSAILSPSRHII